MAQQSVSSALYLGGVFIGLMVIIQIARISYIAFFGPLSHFPGPRVAKATRSLLLWHKLRGNEASWTRSLHATYGDIVQTAPGQLSFASGHAWKDIYGHSSGGKTQQFPKCPITYGNRPPVPDLIFSNDADHSRQRRNFSHAFSDRALRQQEPLLRQYVDELIVKLGEQNGKKLDMVRWYNYTTFDIMGDLAYGHPLGCLSAGEYTPWVALIFQSVKVSAYLTEMKHFPLIRPLIRALLPKGGQGQRDKHWALSAEEVNRRIAKKDSARPDIWGFVLGAKEAQQLTLPEMHSNSQLLMLAGTETTATLLSGLTYHLLKNPDRMEKVKKEIRENFSSPEEINIDAVLRLKYVNACFEEALRCYPPVPTGMPRLVPKGGDIVCGQPIPEGTRVAVHQLSTYMNPNNFRRPTEFLPERWLGDPEFAQDQKLALQPFSVGPRNCLGKNLAYLEMRLIFSNVIWHYDMTLCEEQSGKWNQQRSYTLWEKGPLMVTLSPVVREK